ncbi:hypothetical protein C8F01DRAFT_274367 [Mycena amicta]|nr:hypothetical protein C8F01DRAFT_274367 [Mycena amicta]
MAVPEIPQELFDAIVDHLHDDLAAIKACSLAARCFAIPTRVHIFRRIVIRPPSIGATHAVQDPHVLLARQNLVAHFTEELKIVPSTTQTDFTLLNALLPLLTLTCISLGERRISTESPRHILVWHDMPPTFHASLTDVFRSARLSTIHLHNIQFDTSERLLFGVLGQLAALKTLSLSSILVPQDEYLLPSEFGQAVWLPRLESLLLSDFKGAPICLEMLDHRIDLSQLKSFAIMTRHASRRERVLHHVHTQANIQRLHIWYTKRSRWRTRLHRYITPQLRKLHLFCRMFEPGEMVLDTLITILAVIADRPHLESLVLDGTVNEYRYLNGIQLPAGLKSLEIRALRPPEDSAVDNQPGKWVRSARNAAKGTPLERVLKIRDISDLPRSYLFEEEWE